jgi:hypothetical protein
MVPNREALVIPPGGRDYPLPGETSRIITDWSSWQDWRVSINYLETLTNYDFLSELPDFIEEAIESRSDGLLPNSALLLADESSTANSITDTVSDNLSIGQTNFSQITTKKFINIDSSIPKITSCERYFTEFGTAEISVVEKGIIHSRLSQDGILEVSSCQAGSSQSSSLQYTLAQISPTQIDILKDSISHTSTSEVSFPQINTKQSSIGQVGSSKNDSSQASVLKFNPSQIQPTEVSIPSSITSQQLFSGNLSHNSSPNLLTNIYNTAQALWHTTTPIDLNFAITNLATGQLAEATITGYDQLGRPNTATITIDNDANGVGWFIDSTPQDNSEFTGLDNYLQATPNSAASGKYDLLTTILHEMGHTLGIINGYSEFDKYIKGRQFITDTFTPNLTPDGSHLDTTFHPYDLMNTSLKPGVRKLPSALNLAMINAINAGIGSRESGVGNRWHS